ncbi:MAG: hypothetical protein ABJB12_16200 [Pseudomonadota bacterium]
MSFQSICRAGVFARAMHAAGRLFVAAALSACAKHDVAASTTVHQAYARGDRVVVEQAAAEFFEGRVLAVQSDQLRVQATGGNDSLNVVASDVYRLPPEPRELVPNALVICGRAEAWSPCRVQKLMGESVTLSAATGEAFALPRERVLVPSALTELNLKRYFARKEGEVSFSRSAVLAGSPRPEPGWHPSVHERLLVQLGSDWFTGYVRELGDDSAVLQLNGGQRSATVSFSALTAEPPSAFTTELRHGDFVLLRPATASEPWARWQVRVVDGTEIKLLGAGGAQRSASVRDIVPLRP